MHILKLKRHTILLLTTKFYSFIHLFIYSFVRHKDCSSYVPDPLLNTLLILPHFKQSTAVSFPSLHHILDSYCTETILIVSFGVSFHASKSHTCSYNFGIHLKFTSLISPFLLFHLSQICSHFLCLLV